MTEFFTAFHNFLTFFNAFSEVFPIFLHTFCLRVPPQLLGEIYVLDGQKAEIDIVVQCFGTNHFLSAEFPRQEGSTEASIQRPVFFLELFDHVFQK